MSDKHIPDGTELRDEEQGRSPEGRGEGGILYPRQWPWWAGYAIAITAELFLALVLWLLDPYLPLSRFPILYILTVIGVTYFFGAGAGAMALVLAFCIFLYLSLNPRFMPGPVYLAGLVLAGVILLLVGSIAGGAGAYALRRSRLRIQHVAEELMVSNTALRDEIARRRQVEEALTRSEARFRSTFDRAGIGMTIVDTRGTVLVANPAFAYFIGYSREELPGMNVEQYAYPEDTKHTNKLLKEMVEGRLDSFQSEKRYVTKDGRVVWGRLTASIARNPAPEPPFIIGMIEDITERKEAEETLRRSEEKYRLLFENMNDIAGIDELVYDAAGRPIDWIIRDANPAFEKASGITRDKLVGRRITEIYGLDRAPEPFLNRYA
ncbi:MAG: PAS domain S-box protein, partial [Armatimonadota bacterium]